MQEDLWKRLKRGAINITIHPARWERPRTDTVLDHRTLYLGPFTFTLYWPSPPSPPETVLEDAGIIKLDNYLPADDIALVTLAKTPGGQMIIYPIWCDEDWIEKLPDISSRFRELAVLIEKAMPYMEECAVDFEGKK